MAKKQSDESVELGKCMMCDDAAEFRDIQNSAVVSVCRKHVVSSLK